MAAATFQRRCCSTLVPFWSKDKDERHTPVVRTIRWSAIAAGRSAIPEGSCQHKKEPRPVNRPVAGREAPYVHAGRSRPGQPKYPLVEWPGASTPPVSPVSSRDIFLRYGERFGFVLTPQDVRGAAAELPTGLRAHGSKKRGARYSIPFANALRTTSSTPSLSFESEGRAGSGCGSGA
jgi:hypothetical protein